MIKTVRYVFDNFLVKREGDSFVLEENQDREKKVNREQKILFNTMLHVGYTEFEEGVFSVTSKDIVQFWEYAKDTLLHTYSLETYYALFHLETLYDAQVPTIKTEGSFHAHDFKMTVAWQKEGKTVSTPIAFTQSGLKLKELEFGDTLGTLYPEYFTLYYLIDNANENWAQWNLKARYDFLLELEALSAKRKIHIPQNLCELSNRHKYENALC